MVGLLACSPKTDGGKFVSQLLGAVQAGVELIHGDEVTAYA
jgi:hypothetical protein